MSAQEINKNLRAQSRLITGTQKEIARYLVDANKEIADILQGQPSDYQRWVLPQIRAEIARVAGELDSRAATLIANSMDDAWTLGQSLIDAPLLASGNSILGIAPKIHLDQLNAMREFTTDKIAEVTIDAMNKINGQLGLSVIGAQPVGDTVGNVQAILGSSRNRAITIVRTEIGTAYSAASQARLEQAAEVVPGLQKLWLSSGKLHPRLSHLGAHGQIVDHDEPFIVDGIEIMYPREASLPPEERINCGCTSIPYKEDWGIKVPKVVNDEI